MYAIWEILQKYKKNIKKYCGITAIILSLIVVNYLVIYMEIPLHVLTISVLSSDILVCGNIHDEYASASSTVCMLLGKAIFLLFINNVINSLNRL